MLWQTLGCASSTNSTNNGASEPLTADIPNSTLLREITRDPTSAASAYLQVRSALEPSISPDGRQIAFRTSITGEPEVWVVDAQGGWPRQLSFGGNVTSHVWSPDGRWIIYEADADGNERPSYTLVSPDGRNRRTLLPSSNAYRRLGPFSDDGNSLLFASTERNGEDFDIYRVDIATADSRQVALGELGFYPISWQPGGSLALVSATRGEDANDLYLLNVESGRVEPIFQPEVASVYDQVFWLPDGSGFYLRTDDSREFSAVAFFDLKRRELEIIAAPEAGVGAMALSGDGRYLVWVTFHAGYNQLNVLDRIGDTQIANPELPAGVFTLSFARNAPVLAIGIRGPQLPGDIWSWRVGDAAAHRATHSALFGLDASTFVIPKFHTFSARDGVRLNGWLYQPPAAHNQTANIPLVIHVHGGPTGQAQPTFSGLVQYLLANGVGVFDLNFRGSEGYGKTFARLDNQRLRRDAVDDVADAAQWVGQQPGIDGERLAIMGGSYGGYLVNAVVGAYPETFHGGVSLYGISDWVNALTDVSPALHASDILEYGDITDPQVRAFHEDLSPENQFADIRIPLLVSHGENDPRVPIKESDQLVQTVRSNGIPVEYVRFPDEGHVFRKLHNRVYFNRRVLAFLLKTIGTE